MNRRPTSSVIAWLALGALPALWALSACRDAGPDASSPTATPGEAPGGGPADLPRGPRARAMTLELVLVADDVASTTRAFRAAVRRHHGWVQAANEESEDERSATLDVKVPAAEIDSFRAQARHLAEVERETERVEDVTEQQTDLGARLRNARREEERLLALMGEHTASLGDLVALEGKLAEVRDRIERMDAVDRALAERVSFVNVHAEIRARPVAYWKRPGQTLARAGEWGFGTACALVVGTGAAVAGLGPSVIVLVVAVLCMFYLLKALWRRGRRARAG